MIDTIYAEDGDGNLISYPTECPKCGATATDDGDSQIATDELILHQCRVLSSEETETEEINYDETHELRVHCLNCGEVLWLRTKPIPNLFAE